jgi:hypothetical protein
MRQLFRNVNGSKVAGKFAGGKARRENLRQPSIEAASLTSSAYQGSIVHYAYQDGIVQQMSSYIA